MEIVEYALVICITICLLLIWFVSMYNKFQIYLIRINEAEANIDSVLRKRFDLLNKSINIIKNNSKDEEHVLEIIEQIRSKKLSNFDLDRQLYEGINEFHGYLDKYPTLKKNEELVKINLNLIETEAEIGAFRKYYNDIITDYNKMVKTFPSSVVSLFCSYKYKTYFDGKDMNDEIKNDMKI